MNRSFWVACLFLMSLVPAGQVSAINVPPEILARLRSASQPESSFTVRRLGVVRAISRNMINVPVAPGIFVTAPTARESTNVAGQVTEFFPVRLVTVDAHGNAFDLQPALQPTVGMQPRSDGRTYATRLLVGVLDREQPDVRRPIPSDVWALLTSDGGNVYPSQLKINYTNLPYEEVELSGRPEGDAVTVTLQISASSGKLDSRVSPPHVPMSLSAGTSAGVAQCPGEPMTNGSGTMMSS